MSFSTLISTKLNEHVHKRPGGSAKKQVMRNMNRSLSESWRRGEFKPLELDMEEITHSFRKNNTQFRDAFDAVKTAGVDYIQNTAAIQEAIGMSQYPDFINSCFRMGTFELLGSPSYDPLMSRFPRRFVDCGIDTRYTLPAFSDFEAPKVTEGEETKYFDLGDVTKITDPQKELIRFGIQIDRTMLCVDPNQSFRSYVKDQMYEVVRRRALRQLLSTLLNFNCGASPRDPNFDGIVYNPYLQCGPWCNLYYNQADFDCACQHPAVLACEYMKEDARNPITGDPMDLGGPMDVFTLSEQTSRYIGELLGPMTSKHDPGGCESCEVSRVSRPGWGSVINDVWARDTAHKILCEEFAGDSITEAEIDQMLDRTFIAGNVSRAVEWQVVWDTELTERSGNQTSEYHRSNIVYSAVVSEYSGAAWNNPWAVMKVYGLPDTVNGSGVTPPTSCTDDHPMCGASETAG